MKLTSETANKVQAGDYVRLNHGGGVTVEGAVYAIDVKEGLWLDCPNGGQKVYGPAVFKSDLDVSWPKDHPKMVRDTHSQHFKIET